MRRKDDIGTYTWESLITRERWEFSTFEQLLAFLKQRADQGGGTPSIENAQARDG